MAGRASVRRYSGAMPTFPPLHQDLTFLSPLSDDARRPAGGLPDRARAGHGARRRLRLGRAAAPGARGGPGRDRARDRPRRGVAGPRASRGRRARARRPRDLRGARRPRGERPVRRGHVHRGVPDLGTRRRGGPAARLRRRPDRAAGAAAARRPAGVRRGDLVGASDARRHGAAVRTRRRVRHASAELVDLAEAHGFGVLAAHEASLDEWDAFESGFTAGWVRWLAEHEPDDPEADGGPRPRGAPARGVPRRLPRRPRAWPTCTWSRCERRRSSGSTSPTSTWPPPASWRRSTTPRSTAYPLRHHTAETFLLECRDRGGEGPTPGFWLARRGSAAWSATPR